MDLEESLYIITDIIEGFIEDRTYNRYILDNLLLQSTGESMSYLDYKSKFTSFNKNNISELDKEDIRNNAINILSNLE